MFLQSKGLLEQAPRRGAHRRKRPRRPLPGMMLHQDGSRHEWLAGSDAMDLIVTMDDATSEIYSAFLVEEEGTASTFRALDGGVWRAWPAAELYTPTAAVITFTRPKPAVRSIATHPTQVGRALAHLGVEHIAAYSPEARGRSERMFRHLAGPAGEGTGAGRDHHGGGGERASFATIYIPAHNARFAVKAEQDGSAFVAIPGVDLERDPVHPGGASGRQRQHRDVPSPAAANPAEPAARALRQGAREGAPIPRRHIRDLPRPALSRSLRSQRRNHGLTNCRLNPLGGEPVDGVDKSTTCPPRPQENKSRRSGHLMCYQNRTT